MTTRVPAPILREQIGLIFRAWGMSERQVAPAIEAMVETDRWGVDSHGVSMLMMYEAMRRDGKLNMTAEPRIIRETPVAALVDGDAGLGHAAAAMAMNLAVEKCAGAGVAVVSVFNSHHFGAAGYYAKMAADRGMVGMVTSSARGVLVVPTFGAEPVLGTNPIAFAAPAGRNPPFLLDMATSTVAANKVKVYDFNGWEMPEGWVVDAEGGAVTDPAAGRRIFDERRGGGLTPAGGTRDLGSHKGYGLGVMSQILGSALAGGSFSPIRNRTQTASEPDNIGHFFLAIDPKIFRPPGAFEADVDDVIDTLHATRPADPDRPVLVAGDPEAAAREERLREGVPIPAELMRQLAAVAERADVPFLMDRPG